MAIYKINYLVTGIEDTPALRGYVDTKIKMLEKYLAHYAGETQEMLFDVEVGKITDHHRKGLVFRAEINFSAGSVRLRSEAVQDDLYAAIDEAKDEMDRELRKTKNKSIDFVRRGARRLKEMLREWSW
ncbi:MAG: ribosome-associated translation inhibitor RaiA [Parcubacteria group bacterium]|nr:ribosome-associated translation inhibitor RaiA [Parcubacteria group bacterium]